MSVIAIGAAMAAVTPGDGWAQAERMAGTSFWDHFDFFTASDPTHGYIRYVDEATCRSDGIINVTASGAVRMAVDARAKATGPRDSVRLTSKAVYNGGLFVLDVAHIPTGCGTWPAWWLVGPSWPTHGEIDIIEGVHKNTQNAMTLHTDQGCTQAEVPKSAFSGDRNTGANGQPTTNCWINAPGQYANQGCGILGSNGSYGAPLNSRGGGVYAAEWSTDAAAGGVKVYFWPRGSVPADVAAGKPSGSAAGWGLPAAAFAFDGADCPAAHFSEMQMVFDLVVCGDWAGNTFAQACPGLGTCQQFSDDHPEELAEAYWLVNSVTVYTRANDTAAL
eukprot:CAMPEP_0182928550 /NCGR_PEP_ID=MMETSP0105_2-20130417/15645_1 /TAXON_ID=81532 ORGANISM="Acanthoeca-like sp., Strain 10tr" /NCGR_SAMPLE_ID=MMETSP0105_2 /ASSEMBLY_ACC=CAM_ASM_000205 /LENGTH=332 /DNA_ID=CAMNT_0025066555 /DNA_START=24 /DNA_END=1022 /DNA_ORIENTATION=+